jgi:hypothetical protein
MIKCCLLKISKIQNLFCVIGFLFGISNVILVPPFQIADEDRHFYRAFQVAEGGIIADTYQGAVGGWLPESVLQCGSSTDYMRWKPAEKISRSQITIEK